MFYHPKKYKELHGLTSRKCNTRQRAQGSLPANGALNSDQAISNNDGLAQPVSVRPGPGHKPQATSSKPQAPSIKLSNQPEQATSRKLQAPSNKRQA
jgi:hypothetical protein